MEGNSKPYRLNVGIVVFNQKGEVLAGERLQYPGVFQYPQGGIDKGEDPLDGAKRELYEETGLKLSDPPIGEVTDWLTYEFPVDIPKHLKKFRGQKQKWFFFFWDGQIESLQLDVHEREFSSVKWANIQELTANIVEFKKPVYERVRHDFLGVFETWKNRNSLSN